MEKYEARSIQGVLSAFLAMLSSYFRMLAVPIIILTAVMIIDYATDMSTAFYNSELSSKRGIKGIVKKSAIWHWLLRR